ncbi:hypothetical protein ACOMHN_039032 [Nucella lapillus]
MELNSTSTNISRSDLNSTGTQADDKSSSDSGDDVERYIWIIGGTILLVIGTIGNLLALAVLCRRKMWQRKASLYLSVVAATDLAVLYSGLLRQVLLKTSHLDLRTYR